MGETRQPRRSRTRVRTRLLAIVLVPVLGLTAFTGREATLRIRLSDGSDELAAGVDRVARLAPIALLVAREVYLLSAIHTGETFGLTPAEAGALVGLDLEGELAAVRREVDAGFAGLRPDDPAQAHSRELARVRALDELGAYADSGSAFVLGETSNALSNVALDALIEIQDRALDLEGSARVQRALAVLRAADEVALAAYGELGSLGLLLGGSTGADTSGVPAGQRLREIRRFTAALEASSDTLARIASGPVAVAWRAVDADPEIRAAADAMAAVGEGDVNLPNDPVALAQLFGRAMERVARYYELAELAADAAASEAEQLGDEALTRLQLTAATALALVVSTLLLAALISRSIARPLQRLEAGARRVSAGELDGFDVPTDGPREVVSVAATLDEAVDNLRVVEAQLGVLAAGDLDDGVLAQPVAGRLGGLLHDAVGRLSRSLGDREVLGEQLRHEATHDALTGIPNRSAASDELRRALARAQRAGTPVGVLYVDLDGFKHVNDHHGHDVGDAVLQAAATRLAAGVRNGDFVGRIGGDEFLVITEAAADPQELVALADRLVGAVSEPIAIGAGATRVGASIGIAVTSDGQLDADAVLREADLAAYRAKASGRGRVELFDEALRAEVERRADLEHALGDALRADDLELHFQPLVDQASGGVASVEALLRWTRAGVGPVSPAEFIPVAEASDLIVDIDRWVLRRACDHLVAWRSDPELAHLSVAVNISGRHLLNLTVVDDVREALVVTGADPERLTVEITETVLLTEMPVVVEHLERIRALGVHVAIDDFGTGYTSLAHLRALPADVIKIDRSLVVAAGAAPDVHVLRLLIGTAHALGMRLVAEGVETEEQLASVRALGCDLVQGFLLSRPTPAGGLRDALRAFSPASA